MRTRTNRLAAALVGLVVLAGCEGDSKDEAGVTRTTIEATTSTVPTATVPTATPTTVTVAGPEPVLVDGIPQVTVTPTRAVVGTRVELDGYGFDGEWQEGGPLWFSSRHDEGCSLVAETVSAIEISADGHLTGSFVVPEKGACETSSIGETLIAGGAFDLMFVCRTGCSIGTFTVIQPGDSTEEPTGTKCEGAVFFGPGEDAAGEIYADGLSCEEAKAFLQAHAEPTGAMNGAAHIEADGFSCDRTGSSDRFLPRSNYKCTRGDRTIFFIRT